MPLTHGAMPAWQKSKISKNYRFIKETIDAKDLTDYFVEEEIFDFKDIDEINGWNPNTKEKRNNCFLNLLFNSGPTAYDVFLHALRESSQGFVAERIENTEVVQSGVQEQGANNNLAWFDSIPSGVKNQRLKERELSKLAQTLGSEWEMVAAAMGLSQADIDHAKMDQMTTPMRIYSCLNKWKVRVVDAATFSNFINIVNECPATTIDWDGIKKVVEGIVKEKKGVQMEID